ncbi:hypothetical protein GGS26DRAFT_591198 [Hypomontagnella submonticulosa]|nr:hypothetical protein GGS26DRAFT_591198 [Hypomontagnella submonticulosa]
MSNSNGTRPTPQSLPKLRIPRNRYEPKPEEITESRRDEFLAYCQRYGKAPLTKSEHDKLCNPRPRQFNIPLIPPPPESDSDSNEGRYKRSAEARRREKELDTLCFTENERAELEVKEAEMAEARRQHTEWIHELQAFPRDRETIEQCRHWRLTRERLILEIELIRSHRQVRRNFRRDANNPKGLTNW